MSGNILFRRGPRLLAPRSLTIMGSREASQASSVCWTIVAGLVFFLCANVGSAQDIDADVRPLAPRIVTTIPPEHQADETLSVHEVVELRDKKLDWSPNLTPKQQTLFEMARRVNFRRQIWALEFSFKPLRMITVDVPQPSGKMQRKLIWYMIYNVRNTGQELTPVKKEDGAYEVKKEGAEIRFVPSFVLASHEFEKAYLDRLIPAAMGPIRKREDPNRRFLNSVEMAKTPIPVSTGGEEGRVWGVAMWEEVDPRIDFFSIYVQGLTNAYRWGDPEGSYQAGDPPGKGRRFVRKTLQLNFWRPGDAIAEDEEEIRYGTPTGREELYRVGPGVDYVWVYR